MVTGNPVNPFQPPAPGADVERRAGAGGSLDRAIAGDYDFTISEVMNEAWELTNGVKGTFWGGAIVAYVLALIVFFIFSFVSGLIIGTPDGFGAGFVVGILFNMLGTAAAAPLIMGVVMLGVLRATGRPVSVGVVFAYFDKIVPAALATVLTTAATYAGMLLLILPGIYLALAYAMTMPLIGDRNLPVWQAMETSRKALTHKWFRLFGLYFVVGLLTILSAIPLGIGLIWTVPWSMMVLGVLYKRTFGAPSTAPEM